MRFTVTTRDNEYFDTDDIEVARAKMREDYNNILTYNDLTFERSNVVALHTKTPVLIDMAQKVDDSETIQDPYTPVDVALAYCS